MPTIIGTEGDTVAGIDALTGTEIDELADIRQSVGTILTTPIGTRVMRRTFGSELFDLVDSPGTEAGVLRLIAAAAAAIYRWEDRAEMVRGKVTVGYDGKTVLTTALRVRGEDLTITADTVLG